MFTEKSYKNMRLIVMFDMPVETTAQKREYNKFRKSLIKDGFNMLQYSVYSRYCNNDSEVTKHIERTKKNKPKYGNVRMIKVTENQFRNMIVLVGNQSTQELYTTEEELVIL